MEMGEKNIGDIDTLVRAVLGIALLCAYMINYVAQPWSYVALALGLIMIVTAAYGTCPLYTMLGISTCAVKKKK